MVLYQIKTGSLINSGKILRKIISFSIRLFMLKGYKNMLRVWRRRGEKALKWTIIKKM
jgi:hypothetical protein